LNSALGLVNGTLLSERMSVGRARGTVAGLAGQGGAVEHDAHGSQLRRLRGQQGPRGSAGLAHTIRGDLRDRRPVFRIEGQEGTRVSEPAADPFVLEPEAVDRLRAAGGTIIMDSPEFKRLLKDLGGTLVTQPAATARPPAP